MRSMLLRSSAACFLVSVACNGLAQFQEGCVTLYGIGNNYGTGGVAQSADGGYALAGFNLVPAPWDIVVQKLDPNGIFLWAKRIEAAQGAQAHSIIATADGGYMLGGYTDADLSLGRSFILMKLDAAANVVWTKTFGETAGSMYCEMGGLIQTSDGGFAMSGYSNQGASEGISIVRTDDQGDLLWSKRYGYSGFWGSGIAETPEGDLVVSTGHTISSNNAVVVRVDAAGNTVWLRQYDIVSTGYGFTNFYTVAIAADSSIVLAGLYSGDDTTSIGIGMVDMLAMKVAPNGDPIWATAIGGADTDYAFSVAHTPDGGFALGGQTYTFSTFGTYGAYAAKLDANGQLEWSHAFGTPGHSPIYSTSIAADGDLLFTGRYDATVNGPSKNRLWKMDLAGNSCPNCQGTQQGTANSTTAIVYNDGSGLPGSVVMGWATQGSATFTSTDITASTIYDICGTVGLEEVETTPAISVHPNPFSASTTITVPEAWAANDATMVLTDAMGKEVIRVAVGSVALHIDAHDLARGVYHCRLLVKGRSFTAGPLIVTDN